MPTKIDPKTATARKARGLRNVNLWLPQETVRKLDEICESSGYSRADMVETMVESDWDEWRAIVGRKRQGGSESR